ncbi:MAG: SigE family RNA polymerase sigma factor [Nakamurella sp.]
MGPEEEAQFSLYVTGRRDRVRRTAYLLCGDWHRADDLTQIAFVKLYGAWSQVRDHAALDAYVRRCLVRATVDESRRPWRREHSVDELPETPAEQGPADLATGVVDRQLLRQALEEVPAGQRAVLVLRYFDGLDVAGAAAALECSEGNVKSQTARGLTALKAALARLGATTAGGEQP